MIGVMFSGLLMILNATVDVMEEWNTSGRCEIGVE